MRGPLDRLRGEQRGQASVEIALLAPLLLVVGLALAQVLAARAAGELADHAAAAGAMALLQERDPLVAARAAVPDWPRRRMSVRVDGRRVRVRLRPRVLVPGLGDALQTTAEADAGPRGERS